MRDQNAAVEFLEEVCVADQDEITDRRSVRNDDPHSEAEATLRIQLFAEIIGCMFQPGGAA